MPGQGYEQACCAMLAQAARAIRLPSPPELPGDWSFRQHPLAADAVGAGYPELIEKVSSPLRFSGMVNGGVALVVLAHHYPFGQRQGQAQIHFAVVEDIGLELDAVSSL